ncbi:hypothetical protein [Sneathiella limimaris]|uniref:hypothetical protein n=1 Tax=Sneathiella limimaris TaxID=1964213 RepID=UPI00146D631D|nr:hypothetical protein [Sneathiella limimaris]
MDDKDLFENLSTYKDGELSEEESRKIRELIAENEDAASLYEGIKTVDEQASREFDAMLTAPVPLSHVSSIHAAFEAHNPPPAPRQAPWWTTAIAASIVSIMVSGVIGFFVFDHYVTSLRQEMQQARVSANDKLAVLFQEALEGRSSGQVISFTDPVAEISFELKPVKTYKSSSGHWCREFQERIEQDGRFEVRQGVACRELKGRWYRLKTTIDGEMSRLL